MSTPTKVYCAGPMTMELFNNEYAGRWGVVTAATMGTQDSELLLSDHIAPREFRIAGRPFLYTGPFYGESVHHGATGFEFMHGIGPFVGGKKTNEEDLAKIMMQNQGKLRRGAVARDLRAIRESDLVLAYIDRPDCHGTLFELGYAAALGKKMAVCYYNSHLLDECWFSMGALRDLGAEFVHVCDCQGSPAEMFLRRALDWYGEQSLLES